MSSVLLLIAIVDGKPASSVEYVFTNDQKCLAAHSEAAQAVNKFLAETAEIEKIAQRN